MPELVWVGEAVRAEEAVSLLERTRLFGRLDRDVLRPVAESAVIRSYGKNQSIFFRGDFGANLFVVARGLVKIFLTSEDGMEMVLATLGPSETFGEVALLDGGARSSSASAVQDSVLLSLSRPRFLELMKRHPSLAVALQESVGSTLRRSLDQVSDLAFLDLPGRLAKLLVVLGEERGVTEPEGTVLDLQINQSVLADMVGGSRPSVNQILRSFEKRGYLKLHGRKVVLKRAEDLRRLAGL